MEERGERVREREAEREGTNRETQSIDGRQVRERRG